MTQKKGIADLSGFLMLLVLVVIIVAMGGAVIGKIGGMNPQLTVTDNLSASVVGNSSIALLNASTMLPVIALVIVSVVIIGLVMLFKT